MRIDFLPETLDYFNELSRILYQEGYFGLKGNAIKYVEELLDDIVKTLPTKVKKTAPPYFNRFGKKMLYATFRKNKTTQWYVFFNVYKEEEETVYLVRYISNNHSIAQLL